MTPQPFSELQYGVDLPLCNYRHEAFAQRVVIGESLTQAYRQVYGTDAKSAGANSARLMKNDSVRRRVVMTSMSRATSAPSSSGRRTGIERQCQANSARLSSIRGLLATFLQRGIGDEIATPDQLNTTIHLYDTTTTRRRTFNRSSERAAS